MTPGWLLIALDIGWKEVLWGLFWLFVFIGLYSSLLIGYSRKSARASQKKELPEMYDGKLKATLAENKILKQKYTLSEIENRNYRTEQKAIGRLVNHEKV